MRLQTQPMLRAALAIDADGREIAMSRDGTTGNRDLRVRIIPIVPTRHIQ